jgi:hypothetical protein
MLVTTEETCTFTNVMEEIGVNLRRVPLCSDSQAAESWLCNPVGQAKMMDLAIYHHAVLGSCLRWRCDPGLGGYYHLTDCLTKTLLSGSGLAAFCDRPGIRWVMCK